MAKRSRTQVKQEDAVAESSPKSTRSGRALRSVKKERRSPSPAVTAAKEKPVSKSRVKTESRPLKTEEVKEEAKDDGDSERNQEPTTPNKRLKTTKTSTPESLQARKLKSFSQTLNKSPFPTYLHPTPSECRTALEILSSLHGARSRPIGPITAPTNTAGCGRSDSVLDALVRTILSQNTSDKNSSRAKLSMDAVYGRSNEWTQIVKGGQPKLEEVIRSGGLANVKSKVILKILDQVNERYGKYSLDHLYAESTDDAYKELISFAGVGPKTASCVLLFCLGRESFAVDTHVWRISGLLGWRPKDAGRESTQAHLEVRVPAECKYGLHVLMVSHGKKCNECKAGGRASGKCELRKAFGKKKKEEGDWEEEGLAVAKKEEELD